MDSRKRPVNLDLTKFKFPLAAIISIFHRITGVVLFLAIPFLLYQLQQSLHVSGTLVAAQMNFYHGFTSFIWWVILVALSYHLVAGVRHLLMDFGIGEHVRSGRISAMIVVILTVILAVFWGIFLW